MYNVQVSLEHYEFLKYVTEPRWCSYYKQIEEIINSKAKSVLLIGVGDGIVPYIISKICSDIKVATFDFSDELKPDICGDVRELSSYFDGVSEYDAIVCCQVLEHLPYDEFDKILYQIKMCLKESGKFILSLPDRGVKVRFLLHIPKLLDIKFLFNIPRIWCKKFIFNGEHYWEINSTWMQRSKKIRKVIDNHFVIEKEYLVEQNTYHRFYIGSPRVAKNISNIIQ